MEEDSGDGGDCEDLEESGYVRATKDHPSDEEEDQGSSTDDSVTAAIQVEGGQMSETSGPKQNKSGEKLHVCQNAVYSCSKTLRVKSGDFVVADFYRFPIVGKILEVRHTGIRVCFMDRRPAPDHTASSPHYHFLWMEDAEEMWLQGEKIHFKIMIPRLVDGGACTYDFASIRDM